MSARADTVSVNVELPWTAIGATSPDLVALGDELRLLWIVEQVRGRRIGVGKGAKLANMPRALFMQTLGAHGVPVIDYPAADLEGEVNQLDAQ